MKRIALYILCVVFLFFVLPVIFTQKNKVEKKGLFEKVKEKNNEEFYDYKSLNKLKVLHTKSGQVEEMNLDNYLLGVVSAEMPADFEIEALKAQAVVARTYTIYKIQNGTKHENADICDDSTCCQAWISREDRLSKWNEEEANSNWGKIEEAVNSTKGKVVTYEGKPINAFFHSNSGGVTDTATNVWGGENYPYLQAVATSGENNYTQYNSEVMLSKDDFITKIKEYHNDFVIDFTKQDEIQVLEYTEGERIKRIKVGNLELSGVEVRTIFGLKSAKFEITQEEDNIKFSVIRIWAWCGYEPNRC